ncbi:cytochrome c [Methylococcus capsulatus]|jgi:cytochrome c5|uniref:c-type cytochrome n=1 Tax=Methylococcus capsulatus TaxID=414 RepID=UPI002016DFC8|nr:cytochrome c [Methylococcus capsulatus]UQN12214.1 cytochrome c [Methylococcus capsulatus]
MKTAASLFSPLVLPLVLAGCTKDAVSPPQAPTVANYKPDYRQGMYTYSMYCSRCHDTGAGGAPILDDVDEWESRGILWPSLMQDHVRDGFLHMPSMGQVGLSEQNIADAIYFMTVKIEAAK